MSERSTPIVPHVLYIAEQSKPWRLAAYERLRAHYHTPTTVALEFGTIDFTVKPQTGRKHVTKQQTKVYCLADVAAWERVQATHAALQEALDALADTLRKLGSYAKRLEEAGGLKRAPNPLSPTVVFATDPDDPEGGGYYYSQLVPSVARDEVSSHTPKMLHITRNGKPWSTSHQRNHFVCPDDMAWERLGALHSAAQERAKQWEALLRELGTYRDALADGRYRRLTSLDAVVRKRGDGLYEAVLPDGRVAPARVSSQGAKDAAGAMLMMDRSRSSVAPAQRFPELTGPHFYAHHRNESRNVLMHIWRSEPSKSAKIRFVSVCGMAMQHEEPRRIPDLTKPALELCGQCRQGYTTTHQEEPVKTTTSAHAGVWHNLPPLLSKWTWDGVQTNPAYPPTARLRSPDGYQTAEYERSNHAIAEALRYVHSKATAIAVPAAVVGDVMMGATEAREALQMMRGDLEQIDASLSSFRQRALDFADRQGWKALGYGGALEAINAELGTQYSKSYLSRLLGAGRIERILELPIGNSVPEGALRPLGQLDTPEQQRQAWQQATTAAGGTPKVQHVQQAVEAIKPKPASEPIPPPPLPTDLQSAGLYLVADGGNYRIRGTVGPLASWQSSAQANINGVINEARDRIDELRIAEARKLLIEAPKWTEGEQIRLYQDAYALARQLRDLAKREALFAEIDAAVDASGGKRATAAPAPEQLPTITLSTDSGLVEIQPVRLISPLALHRSIGKTASRCDWTISHRPTGLFVAGFAKQESAEAALVELGTLEWALGQDTMPPVALAEQVRAILARYDDEIQFGRKPAAPSLTSPAPAPPAPPPAADDLKAQARARFEPLLRTGFARLQAETIVLRLIAMGVCDRDQRDQVALMPLHQLHDLLIGRLFAQSWSSDPAPLLALLKIEALEREATS